MADILRARLLSNFTCLGDKCEDTCCQGWSMQMDEPTLARYRNEAPELLSAVETGHDGAPIMRKDPATGFCVKLENGLCGIHKNYGEKFLGDACYFYPRVTRALGDQMMMTAAMSCPEIARLMLADDDACVLEKADPSRLPQSLKNYLPQEITTEEALAVHQAFLNAAKDNSASAEQIFLRIASASRSFERIEKKSWPAMAEFYLKNADTRIPPAETSPADPFNLLHALCGLAVASKKKPSVRLMQTIGEIEQAIQATLDWENVLIHADDQSLGSYREVRASWQNAAPRYAPLLRRWLMMELSLALYPFAGLGNRLVDRITIIGVRLATVKLALMSAHSIYKELPQETVVRVMQSLSRFLDHLADPVFSLQIYAETGWLKEPRMRGLLGDGNE